MLSSIGPISSLSGRTFNYEGRVIPKTKFFQKYLNREAIDAKGNFTDEFVHGDPINSENYINDCIKKILISFIDKYYSTNSETFWPDTDASARLSDGGTLTRSKVHHSTKCSPKIFTDVIVSKPSNQPLWIAALLLQRVRTLDVLKRTFLDNTPIKLTDDEDLLQFRFDTA
ncbi:hypothetical protein EVAR_78497_1 [Eumeta japonica]|uniref:Uncharacterized protein n=1 Tax=Eumeta variegata TaxID=151549 RepID=A0A4C1TYM3_EUMVA|nr:hypothetical protein EVAR_78497_1 [Eumeta japonica]